MPLLALDWTVLLGGGFVLTVLLLALIERLRRTFASRDELSSLQRKLHAIEMKLADMGVAQSAHSATLTHLERALEHIAARRRVTDAFPRNHS